MSKLLLFGRVISGNENLNINRLQTDGPEIDYNINTVKPVEAKPPWDQPVCSE